MRPFRSFLLLLLLLACLTGVCLFFPHSNLVPDLPGLFPGLSKLISYKEIQPGGRVLPEPVSDTIIIRKPEPFINADTANQFLYKKENLLVQFIDSLNGSKNQVRIMYYGDSQIEGDRITSNMRHAFREGRKGTGPGLFLPVMPVMYTKSLWLRSSSNWIKYNYLSYRNGEITHNRLGPFMAVCRFLPPGRTSTSTQKAWVKIRPSQYADSSVSEYELLRIFYSNLSGKVSVKVMADERRVLTQYLRAGSEVNEISCNLAGAKNIILEFQGKTSPDIYGISIESRDGIIVDNIPQRGSAGLEFTMVDKKNLIETFDKIKPDLIILQYGLNIVKNIRNNYSYYERGLYRQVERVKEVTPGTRVMVIGVTDMAISEGDSVRSYPNIPSIIRSQKEAADESGAIFWDSYSAMGGNSSIIAWAKEKPPLAQSDYVHFTYKGADSISKLLYTFIVSSGKRDTGQATVAAKTPDTSQVVVPVIESAHVVTPVLIRSNLNTVISEIFSYDPDRPFIFTTAAFWIFFLIVLAGYSLVYKKQVIRNIYLFLISLFFYYKTGGLFLIILIFVTVVDYSCGLLINRSNGKAARKFFVLLSIVSNLGLLGYFKYTGFFINTINDVFGTQIKVYDFLSSVSNSFLGTSFDISYIILPVGISFFTFQSLSYTIDVYRRKMEPVRNIIDFGFYVSFFPHLVAGPIVRASFFIPQIYQEYKLTSREFSHSLYMISKGLIKKIIISNFIAINLVDRVFDTPAIYSGFENLMAIYGYGLQIYCDFSGYTDIAIGVALILGFRLPVNFNSPYKAINITDFWKRWHISLSQWLRDYLYISLGGNRKGKFRTYLNLMITMLLGGLWHGASLRYVIWGGLHGMGLVVNKIWSSLFRNRKAGWPGRLLAIFITFNFVNFCWIFFRAPDLGSAILMLKQVIENFSPGSFLTVIPAYSSVLILMVVGYIIHFLPERVKESYRGFFIRIPLIVQLVIVFLIAIMLYQMRTTEVIPFIYFRF